MSHSGSLHLSHDEDLGVKIDDHTPPCVGHWLTLTTDGADVSVHASRDQLLRLASVIVSHLAPWCDSDFTVLEPVPQLGTPKEISHVE